MKNRFAVVKSLLAVSAIFIVSFSFAQTAPLQSRVAVVSSDTKTNIWVSDFPKKTTVVLMDSDNNLLTIISTNDFGSAYISLPSSVKTDVTAKTLNGEISVSNKVVFNNNKTEQSVTSIQNEVSEKTNVKA